jgi:hypothetical protein
MYRILKPKIKYVSYSGIAPKIMDSQLGCLFELIDLVWGPIPQRRRYSFAVVEPLNVIKNALPCLSTSLIPVMKNQSSFQ